MTTNGSKALSNGHQPAVRLKSFEQQNGESIQAFAAFRAYLEMGDDRSTRAVAQKLGKSSALMMRWSARWKWPDRIREYNKSLTLAIDKKSKSRAIARRLPDIMGISEILARTSFLARASLDNVLSKTGKFDIVKARRTGGIHTIKTMHFHRDSGEVKSITLRDHNQSLEIMGKHFRLWDDDEDPDAEAKRLLEEEKARKTVEQTAESPESVK